MMNNKKMSLGVSTAGWAGLALVLFLGTFGPLGGVCLLFYVVSFIAGGLMILYYYGKKKAAALDSHGPIQLAPPSIGITKLVEEVRREKPSYKFDKRMTGANIIDEALQEVLNYTYRDYIHTWYRKISDDQQFKYDMRMTLQRVIIAFSERSKQVDLVPYFTTRCVDDFASHIRLYRRALDKVREHRKDDTKPPPDLESIFFDLETEMENNMCRDMVCMSEESERQYLQDLSEVLLFLLLPPEDFHNKPFRYIVREVLVNGIFLPTINLVSDPDYINQTILWMCKETSLTNEFFITILKTTDAIDELNAVREKVDLDIARQRSKDTGGEDGFGNKLAVRERLVRSLSVHQVPAYAVIKQQLSSLLFVKSVCESRIQRLNDGLDEPDLALQGGVDISKLLVPGQKLYSLPFDVVLNNNVALSSFIEFMTNIGAQGYLFFYLTVEGYRVSAEQQISAALLSDHNSEKPDLDMLRDAAQSIFDQYLSEKASPKLNLGEYEHLITSVEDRIQNQEPSDTIFDEVQARVWDILQADQYFPTFKRSQLYIKLLAELDLLKDGNRSDDSLNTDDEAVSSKSSSLQASIEDLASSCDSGSSLDTFMRPNLFTLSAQITNTGICREHGKAYGVYLITVTKTNADNTEETWDVYRRYSDFHDLHMTIQSRYDSLQGLALPSKKAFNNTNKEFLEKRRIALNAYLQTLLNAGVLNNHRGLLELVYQFLEHIVWEKEKSTMARKMDTFVNPLKNSVRNMGNIMKAVPDNFADGVAKISGGVKSIPSNMLDGVGKVLNVKGAPGDAGISKEEMLDSAKVGASLDEDEDNIPLRIMLLLMDEVFDIKHRHQWLRRRIVAILRQIIKATMGDSINRKIVEHVEWLTSAEQVAEYVKAFRDAFWPNGVLAEPRPTRDLHTMMRTRVACKAKMLAGISDEVRHLIGSETTRKGTLLVFNMFQHARLNRRLVYVLLEGILETLFPDNKFNDVFRKLHSRSPRVRREQPAQSEAKIPASKRQLKTKRL